MHLNVGNWVNFIGFSLFFFSLSLLWALFSENHGCIYVYVCVCIYASVYSKLGKHYWFCPFEDKEENLSDKEKININMTVYKDDI